MLANAFLLASLLLPSALASPLTGRTRPLGNSFGVLNQNATYDYIVVGGGTAGLTMAARLAAKNGISVAVIEAGGFYEQDNGNVSQIPGYASRYMTFGNINPPPSLVDWDMVTEPQQGLNGRKIHYTVAKTLGGGSALHTVYHRPTKGSLNLWADTVGDKSYQWDQFSPYLEKSFQFTPPHNLPPNAFDLSAYSHGIGPAQLSFPNYIQPFDSYMNKAYQATGFKPLRGLNSGSVIGYSPGTYTIDPKTQLRSTSQSFLDQAVQTTDLKVYIKTTAKKILFDGNKKAVGVTVECDNTTWTLSARNEVIISAGVFHSPQLLMVSGVGPATTLQQYGIPVISDLQGVGQNLQDHVFIFTSHETKITTNSAVLSDPALHAQAVEQFLDKQNGPLTGVGGDIVGFEKLAPVSNFSTSMKSHLAQFPSDWPDVEYLNFAPNSNPSSQPSANNYEYVVISLQSVNSIGYVNITGPDTDTPPTFNTNLLATDYDQQLAIAAVRRARQLAIASGIQIQESTPGSNVTSDADLLAWIKSTAVVGDHASSTCAMGKAGDPHAVIDSQARVFGVSGLRVVDASSFPMLPAGHPLSTVYALAEKIADQIVKSH